MSVESPGFANQNSTYGAEQTRRAIYCLLPRNGGLIGSVSGGVIAATDCLLTAPVSGMSVNVAAGEVIVPGSSAATQSGYYCRVSSTTNLAIAASNTSNPRVDMVVAEITDSAYSGGTNTFALAVVTGTPTSGATLANLSGVGAQPTSSYILGYVLVPANATNIVTADIANVAALAAMSLPPLSFGLSMSPVSGNLIRAAGGSTYTLPNPTSGSIVGIAANTGVSGTNQVTVSVGSSGSIYGGGMNGASSFKLGTPGATVLLEADGGNWYVIAGQQDTGWVSFGIPSGFSTAAFGRLVGDRVDLRGAVTGTALISATLTLSAPFLPSATRYFPVYTFGTGEPGSSSVTTGGSITSGGTLTMYANPDDPTFTIGLDGSFYHL